MPHLLRYFAWFQKGATHDFFPGFSAQVRRTIGTPLGVLVATLFVAIVCGLFLHPRIFTLSGGIAFVLAAGICWPWIVVRGNRTRIFFEQPRAMEGEAVAILARTTNHLPIPSWGLALREGNEKRDRSLSVRFGGIPSRIQAESRWVFRPTIRGVYPRSPLYLSTGFPFGIWEPRRLASCDSPLLVWPQTFPVGPVPVMDGEDVIDGNVTRNKVGTMGDVVGLRPYRRGDSPRRVHWAQSARHDRLIVCELHSNSRPVVLLVLDADPTIHTLGPNGSREWSIRILASLAKGWLETGAQVGTVWSGFVCPPASGSVQLLRIMDGLARLPDSGQLPLSEVLRTGVGRVATGVRIGITTDEGHVRLASHSAGIRWAVLRRNEFQEPDLERASFPSCDEGPIRNAPRPWIEFDGPERVPHALRYGWSEARHGS